VLALVQGFYTRNKQLPRYVPLVGVPVLLVRSEKWHHRPERLEDIGGVVLPKIGIGPTTTVYVALPKIIRSILHLRRGCNRQDAAMLDLSVRAISLGIMEPDVVILDSQVHVRTKVFKLRVHQHVESRDTEHHLVREQFVQIGIIIKKLGN
jgi:hypothetical protein